MMYFLDSNICIHYMRHGRIADIIDAKLMQHKNDVVSIPVVVLCELLHGAYHSKRVNENLNEVADFVSNFEVIPFDAEDAAVYGQIRASLESKGQVIGNNDMLIAASTLLRNATLVTNNTKEFSRIDGLILEDWTI